MWCSKSGRSGSHWLTGRLKVGFNRSPQASTSSHRPAAYTLVYERATANLSVLSWVFSCDYKVSYSLSSVSTRKIISEPGVMEISGPFAGKFLFAISLLIQMLNAADWFFHPPQPTKRSTAAAANALVISTNLLDKVLYSEMTKVVSKLVSLQHANTISLAQGPSTLASGVTQLQDGSLETWWEVFYQREDFYLKRGRSQQDTTPWKWCRRALETCSYATTKVTCTLMLVYGNLCRCFWGRISLWSTTCLQRHFLPLITFAWGCRFSY